MNDRIEELEKKGIIAYYDGRYYYDGTTAYRLK